MESTIGQGPRNDAERLGLNPLLIAAMATILVLTLVLALISRMSGYDASVIPESPVLESRQLGFRDMPGGVVEVFDWQNGTVLRTVPSGEGSFIRGVVRSLVRQRRGLASETMTPFELRRHADSRLVLADTETGESIDLVAFGPTNFGEFAAFLDTQTAPSPGGTH